MIHALEVPVEGHRGEVHFPRDPAGSERMDSVAFQNQHASGDEILGLVPPALPQGSRMGAGVAFQ
jgi:hypothetical protein